MKEIKVHSVKSWVQTLNNFPTNLLLQMNPNPKFYCLESIDNIKKAIEFILVQRGVK